MQIKITLFSFLEIFDSNYKCKSVITIYDNYTTTLGYIELLTGNGVPGLQSLMPRITKI